MIASIWLIKWTKHSSVCTCRHETVTQRKVSNNKKERSCKHISEQCCNKTLCHTGRRLNILISISAIKCSTLRTPFPAAFQLSEHLLTHSASHPRIPLVFSHTHGLEAQGKGAWKDEHFMAKISVYWVSPLNGGVFNYSFVAVPAYGEIKLASDYSLHSLCIKSIGVTPSVS